MRNAALTLRVERDWSIIEVGAVPCACPYSGQPHPGTCVPARASEGLPLRMSPRCGAVLPYAVGRDPCGRPCWAGTSRRPYKRGQAAAPTPSPTGDKTRNRCEIGSAFCLPQVNCRGNGIVRPESSACSGYQDMPCCYLPTTRPVRLIPSTSANRV